MRLRWCVSTSEGTSRLQHVFDLEYTHYFKSVRAISARPETVHAALTCYAQQLTHHMSSVLMSHIFWGARNQVATCPQRQWAGGNSAGWQGDAAAADIEDEDGDAADNIGAAAAAAAGGDDDGGAVNQGAAIG